MKTCFFYFATCEYLAILFLLCKMRFLFPKRKRVKYYWNKLIFETQHFITFNCSLHTMQSIQKQLISKNRFDFNPPFRKKRLLNYFNRYHPLWPLSSVHTIELFVRLAFHLIAVGSYWVLVSHILRIYLPNLILIVYSTSVHNPKIQGIQWIESKM